MKVAVLDDWHGYFQDIPSVQRLRQRAEVRVYSKPLGPEERVRELREVEAILLLRERTRVDQAFLRDAPALHLISQTGRTGPHLDVVAATEAGILIATTAGTTAARAEDSPSGGVSPTAELTLGLMMALMRQIPQGDRAIREGGWVVPYGRVLRGKTLGIIGLGNIGREVARLGQAFGMRVIAWSRSLTPERGADLGVQALGLEEALSQADVVSVHLALNDGTRGFLSAERLRLLKPGAYFINTARAAIIDNDALLELLRQRKVAGAALDVFLEEPLPPGHPFTRLDNVVLTPHIGWPTDSGYAGMADAAVRNIEAYLDGTLANVANPEARAFK